MYFSDLTVVIVFIHNFKYFTFYLNVSKNLCVRAILIYYIQIFIVIMISLNNKQVKEITRI